MPRNRDGDADNLLNPVLDSLREYMPPEESLRAVGSIMLCVSPEKWILDPGYDPIREAWAASIFAWGLQQQGRTIETRLQDRRKQFPDFLLKYNDSEHEFEIVEAMHPQRRRDEEYRGNTVPPENRRVVMSAPDDAVASIVRSIELKARKSYACKPNLLVVLNLSVSGVEVENAVSQCGALTAFRSVWLLAGRPSIDRHCILKLADTGYFLESLLEPMWFS